MNNLSSVFESFHPIEGEIEGHFAIHFREALRRARNQVSDFSMDDFHNVAKFLDWVFDSKGKDISANRLEKSAYNIDRNEVTVETSGSPTETLISSLPDVELPQLVQNRKILEFELFAVLAICQVALAHEEKKNLIKRGIDYESDVFCENIGEFAIYATEAASTAEAMIVLGTDILPQLIDSISSGTLKERSSRAAKARHEPQQKIKRDFCQWFIKNEGSGLFKSKAQAATKFYNSLSNNEKTEFSESNAQRTLLDALREFLRERARS